MTEALFALAGTALGILGTVLTDGMRAHREDKRARREALLRACTEFVAGVSRLRSLAFDISEHPDEPGLRDRARQASWDLRVCYEQLRLLTGSIKAQEAGRHALRYAFGLQRAAEGSPLRDDERERGPMVMLQESLLAEVRREAGIPNPDDLWEEPPAWLGFSRISKPGGDASP
jgi:hypothetical protein